MLEVIKNAMKTLVILIFSLCALSFTAKAQYQSEAFIKQQEKLRKKYKGQQATAIALGSFSGLSLIGWGVALGSKPQYTYTGISPTVAENELRVYNKQISNWKTVKTSLLISGAATGIGAIVFGALSSKYKHLHDTNKMTLRFTPNNGLGLCMQFKAY